MPAANIVLGGSGANRTVTVTPASNQSGSATITLTVSDGSLTASSSFVLTVTAGGSNGYVYLSMEAESASLVSPTATNPDVLASQGNYITSSTSDAGTATFHLSIPTSGTYLVWCRVKAVDPNTDSFYVSVDGASEDVFDMAEGTWQPTWQWVELNGRDGGAPLTLNPRTLSLSTGSHTLTFRGREADSMLDRILVTNDLQATPPDAPSGLTIVGTVSP